MCNIEVTLVTMLYTYRLEKKYPVIMVPDCYKLYSSMKVCIFDLSLILLHYINFLKNE